VTPEIGSDQPVPDAPDFSCATRREHGRAVVSVQGDIDIATAPTLYAALRDALHDTTDDTTDDAKRDAKRDATELVVADFAEVTFIDSSGVQCLLAAQRDADQEGAKLGVQNARPNVFLVFELLGLTDQLVVRGESASEGGS
jgi:anti-sigma B factor antagonist